MSDSSSVRGTILSSSPCSVWEASAFLQQFLASETLPESNLVRGFLVSVIGALDELTASHTPKRKERSEKKKKKKGVDTAVDGPESLEETPGLQLQVWESPETAKRSEDSSKRSEKKKKKGVDTTVDGPESLEETPGLQLQAWEPPESAKRSEDSSKRSRKKRHLDTAEEPETLAESPGVVQPLQVRDSAESVEPSENASKRSRKRRSLDTASEDSKPLGETPGVQLHAGKSKEPAEPLENGSKRSKSRKSHDTASKDPKTLIEAPGLRVLEPAELFENGLKHGSHTKNKSYGVKADLSADDTHVKHRSKKKHRASESSQNEDNAGKSSSVRSDSTGRTGGNETRVHNRSGVKDNQGAALTVVGPTDIEKGNQVSMEGFSLRTRDLDDLRSDGLDGAKGSSSRSKGSAGKGSHSKNQQSAASELEDRTPSGGRHKRKRDPGSDEKSVDVPKRSDSKHEGHTDGLGTSVPEAPRESPLENHVSKKSRTKKNMDTMGSEGNQNSERKHSHKMKNLTVRHIAN